MTAVLCPGCHRRLQLANTPGGQEGKCAHCGRHVRFGGSTTDPSQETNDTASNLAPETSSHPPSPPRSSAPGYEFLTPPERPDEIGRLGNFRILELLGQGAMGMVFRAEDMELGRTVALKVMLPSVASVPENRERFRREAQATALVSHPNVIPIYNIGEARGVSFLAMPLLKGELLDARLSRERRMPIGEAVRIGKEIAAGLAAAHASNLIHRDIKPANLWLERRNGPDRVKILDFGLARIGDAGLTNPGAVLGTPAYMSPEQARGLPVDYRCDLFSLGCVLYRMLTGERAFQGNEVFAVLMALTTVHPPAPHEVNPAVPPALSHLVMHLLAKEPGDRPQSAAEVVEALNRMGLASPSSSTDRMAVHRGSSSGHIPVFPPSSPTLPTVPPAKGQAANETDTRVGRHAAQTGVWALVILLVLLACMAAYSARGLFGFGPQGTVLLDVRPADSEVLVDSKPAKLDGAGTAALTLSPGKHSLKVLHKDYHGYTQELEVVEGNSNTVSIKLDKLETGPPEKGVPGVPAPKEPAKEAPPKEGPRSEVVPGEVEPKPPAPKEKEVPNKAVSKEEKPERPSTVSKTPSATDPATAVPPKGLTEKSNPPTTSKVKENKPAESATVKQPMPQPQPPVDRRRVVAEWVLARGGQVNIKVEGAELSQTVRSATQIPKKNVHFELLGVDLGRKAGVNDAGVKRIADIPELESVDLSETAVTDGVMATLATLPALKILHLDRTAVGDGAVPRLKRLKLIELGLQETKVSDAKFKELRDALPRGCLITQ